MESRDSHRRQFLKLMALAALSVQLLPTQGASAGETAPADSLAVTSSRNSKLGRWAYHSHVLYLPLRLFRAPPRGGVTLSTTWAFLHSHEVTLTEAQLITVARGGKVDVKESSGVHTFSIGLG